jgi:DEAD/DEAH box helicase domain-containing protein
MLDGILRALPKLEKVDSLSELSNANVGESALERRFARTLEASIEAAGGKVRRVPHAGRVQWSFELAGHRWRMVGQPLLGPSEGVSIPSQPDYVIAPTAKVSEDGTREHLDDVRAIAVFCDGFEFHAQPSQDVSRLDDDARKRSAILESGRYRVWSVTWADLDACDGPTARRRFASLDEAVALGRTQKTVVGDALSDTTGAMALLLAYLHDPPRDSNASSGVATTKKSAADPADPVKKSDFARLAEDAARRLVQGTLADPAADLSALLDPRATLPARARGLARHGATWLGLTRLEGAPTFVLRLQDAVERRRDADYLRDWNAWLDAHVILQFVDELGATLRFVTDASLAAELPSVAPMAEETTSIERDGPRDAPAWDPIVEQWTEQAVFWRMLHEAGLPPPSEELDLERPPSDVQLVLAEARAVLAYDVTERERARWAERGFVLVDLDRVKERDAARAAVDDLASRAARRSDT